MHRHTQISYLLLATCLLCCILLVSCQNQTMTSSGDSSAMRTIVLHDPTSDQYEHIESGRRHYYVNTKSQVASQSDGKAI
jgi:hypothetical protein